MMAELPGAEPASSRPDVARAPDPSPAALDRIVHDRIRLGILAALALNASLTFIQKDDYVSWHIEEMDRRAAALGLL